MEFPCDDPARLADELSDPAAVRRVQRGYVRHFAPGARILDVGCGRGLFLDLLREAGLVGLGIEASDTAVAACRARGLAVQAGDVFEVLERLAHAGERFGGIIASHVVEHFAPDRAARLLRLLAARLQPGGRLVVVTPNPKSLIVLGELFWLDPTHVRPYPRRLLELLGRRAGLEVLESYDDPASVPRRRGLRRWLARVRSALSGADRSGPLDSVVVFGRT